MDIFRVALIHPSLSGKICVLVYRNVENQSSKIIFDTFSLSLSLWSTILQRTVQKSNVCNFISPGDSKGEP